MEGTIQGNSQEPKEDRWTVPIRGQLGGYHHHATAPCPLRNAGIPPAGRRPRPPCYAACQAGPPVWEPIQCVGSQEPSTGVLGRHRGARLPNYTRTLPQRCPPASTVQRQAGSHGHPPAGTPCRCPPDTTRAAGCCRPTAVRVASRMERRAHSPAHPLRCQPCKPRTRHSSPGAVHDRSGEGARQQ